MKNTICIFLLTSLLQLLHTSLPAQSGYGIRVKMDGCFHFQSGEPAEPGQQALLLKPGSRME